MKGDVMGEHELVLHVRARVAAQSPTIAKALLEMAGRALTAGGESDAVLNAAAVNLVEVWVSEVRRKREKTAQDVVTEFQPELPIMAPRASKRVEAT